MASTYSELYSDYLDNIKQYAEKLDVTPMSFMRALTRATQLFQRETEIIETSVDITIDANNDFVMPTDVLRVLEVKDANNIILLFNEATQFTGNIEQMNTGIGEAVTIRSHFTSNAPSAPKRLVTIHNRKLYISGFTAGTDTKLNIRYIPDIPAFSKNTNLWSAWFIDEDAFDVEFDTASILPGLSFYENALVDMATASFIKSQGNANYRVYETSFWQEVQRAKDNKATYFMNAVVDAKFPFAYTHSRKYGV